MLSNAFLKMPKILLFLPFSLLFFAFTKKKTPIITLFRSKQTRRGCDGGGCGNYGASRDNGTRKHEGLDILCEVGGKVFAPFDTIVQREVKPYASDARFNGLQLFAKEKNIILKIMYFKALSHLVGQTIKAGALIGYAQNISEKYGASVPPHLHIEIFKNGVQIDPEPYLFP